MIKNYKQFNESLKDKLVGPTEDEVLNNLKDLSPDDLLIKSCKIGLVKGIEIALERGADINFNRNQALSEAVFNNNLEIIKLLHKNGVDINYGSDVALRDAAYMGYTEIVNYLLDNGANPFSMNNRKGPFELSIERGHNETAELIKKYMERND